jgi:hypothetical protein
MRILEIDDRDLFLKYAIPCGQVLVDRGSLDREVLENLRKRVAARRPPRESIEDCFPVAARMATIIAHRMGKERIDEEVIRRYFLSDHDQAVRWRSSIFPDIKVDECLIHPGRIVRREGDLLVAKTPRGELSLRGDFAPEAKRGDLVTVHYDFISEITGRKDFDRLLRMRT